MHDLPRPAAERSTPPEARSAPPRRVRWWPAAAILVLAGLASAFVWLVWDTGAGERNIAGLSILGAALIALAIWTVAFSGMGRRVRLSVLIAAIAAVAALFATLEIRGVSGDMIPIVAWRWAPQHDRALAASAPAASRPAAGRAALPEPPPGAADYPQFLGPDRYPVLEGRRLSPHWSADPPRELWRIRIGAGWSGFAVRGGLAVTMEQRGDHEMVTAYELATGEPIWSHADRARFDTVVGGIGPRSTPTLTDSRVYTLGATGLLNCLDLATGESIWSRDVFADHNAQQIEWGAAGSPLIVDGMVVVNTGASPDHALAAYDEHTGEPVWAANTEDEAAYASPMVATVTGQRQIVMFNHASITGHDIADGSVLWRADWQRRHPKVAQPLIIDGDKLFVTGGYGAGCALFHITRDDAGEFHAEQLWRTMRMKAKFANVVEREGYIYGLDDGILACIDLTDGERMWKGGRYGHGQMILIGDTILLTAENGEVVLIEANPDELVELARFAAFDHKLWNSPALAGRYLLLRTDREAACYELPLE